MVAEETETKAASRRVNVAGGGAMTLCGPASSLVVYRPRDWPDTVVRKKCVWCRMQDYTIPHTHTLVDDSHGGPVTPSTATAP